MQCIYLSLFNLLYGVWRQLWNLVILLPDLWLPFYMDTYLALFQWTAVTRSNTLTLLASDNRESVMTNRDIVKLILGHSQFWRCNRIFNATVIIYELQSSQWVSGIVLLSSAIIERCRNYTFESLAILLLDAVIETSLALDIALMLVNSCSFTNV